MATAGKIAELVTSVLNEHHKALLQVNDKHCPPARMRCYQDIKDQLHHLFVPDWLHNVPFDRLQHYPRYLKAIQMRIDRLQGHIERDNTYSEEVTALWKQYEIQLTKASKLVGDNGYLDEYRWMLEEYRVSVFAQGIKTPSPISLKRLEKMWAKVVG